MEGKVVGRLKAKNGQEVNIVQEQGLRGYRFDAIGKESLSFAVDLALAQTQGKLDIKDGQIRGIRGN